MLDWLGWGSLMLYSNFLEVKQQNENENILFKKLSGEIQECLKDNNFCMKRLLSLQGTYSNSSARPQALWKTRSSLIESSSSAKRSVLSAKMPNQLFHQLASTSKRMKSSPILIWMRSKTSWRRSPALEAFQEFLSIRNSLAEETTPLLESDLEKFRSFLSKNLFLDFNLKNHFPSQNVTI